MEERLKVAIKAVKKAGDFLEDQFRQHHRVSIKSDKTIQLNEDVKSEEILISTISKSFPNDSFWTEESETKINGNGVWVFDPICGTYSYYRGVETWSVSMAFISDDKYEVGVVYCPFTGDLFYSLRGQGAFLNGQKIQPSKIQKIDEAFVSVENRVFKSDKVDLFGMTKEIRRLRVGHGSGGELSYVAAGFTDALIKTGQTLEHFAGGRAVLEEAGGVFLDFTGKRAPTYFDKTKEIDYLACSNMVLAQEILKRFVK